jgi:hypothetical protein
MHYYFYRGCVLRPRSVHHPNLVSKVVKMDAKLIVFYRFACFFYETIAPLMLIGRTSLLAISTLTSDINFYTRLIKMKDPTTLEPMFSTFCVELSCQDCKDSGKQVDCKVSVSL